MSRSHCHKKQQHSWSKGRIPPFQGGDPGSSPGGCTFLSVVCVNEQNASAAGLEPATPRSEVWCSIQLSYERKKKRIKKNENPLKE